MRSQPANRVPAELRQILPERGVTRRVDRPWSTVERLLADPDVFPPGYSDSLGDCGTLRLDGRFDRGSRDLGDLWTARGRVVGRGPRLVLFSRVDVLVTPWSTDACELRVVPCSRSLHRWGARRLHRYWRLAHAAADLLLGVLRDAPGVERVSVHVPKQTSTIDVRTTCSEAILAREG